MIALITGGSGCGKSTYAEGLIASTPAGRRLYIATMQVYDEESRKRVARHRAQRADKGFETLEYPKGLLNAPIEKGRAALLEDLPNLLANEMFDGGDPDQIVPALKRLGGLFDYLVIVTNDVFADGVRYPDSTQDYIRALARINREAARLADYAAEVVYSIPVALKGEWTCAS